MKRVRKDIHPVVAQLTALRKIHEMSQRDIAQRMGTQQSAISDIETGCVQPTLNTIEKWAAIFKQTINLLPVRDE